MKQLSANGLCNDFRRGVYRYFLKQQNCSPDDTPWKRREINSEFLARKDSLKIFVSPGQFWGNPKRVLSNGGLGQKAPIGPQNFSLMFRSLVSPHFVSPHGKIFPKSYSYFDTRGMEKTYLGGYPCASLSKADLRRHIERELQSLRPGRGSQSAERAKVARKWCKSSVELAG